MCLLGYSSPDHAGCSFISAVHVADKTLNTAESLTWQEEEEDGKWDVTCAWWTAALISWCWGHSISATC